MPYIPMHRRSQVELNFDFNTPGELNFFITTAILQYLEERKEKIPVLHRLPNKYRDYNEVMGVLECVKQELYRKVISKYEDKKCEQNGEVF